MKKRIMCALMTLVMLFSLVPVTALTASAASVSNDLVEVIKVFENNTEFEEASCYKDGSQYSIGYGTVCPGSDEDHENGKVHTITEAEAKAALAKELDSAASAVSKFAVKYGLSLTQGQFDALVSFSYNCGTGWMSADGIFRQAVIEGKTGNDFLYAITLWSVGGVGLANRRLCEAAMYLDGVYTTTAPANYTYVRLDANGGSMEYSIQGYDTVEPVGIVETPTRTGYKFMGWYDADGAWVTTLNAATAKKTLTAKWQKVVGGGVEGGSIVGTPVSYAVSASLASSLNIYKLPGTGAEILGTVKSTDLLDVVAEYIDNDNVKWVKLAAGGWISMGDVDDPVIQNSNVTVTVTNTYINVRQKPGAYATIKIVGKVYQNDKLRITEFATVNGALWGKFTGGWIALEYTDYEKVAAQDPVEEEDGIESNGNTTVIATGVVSASTYVHVRKGPGTDKAAVNTINTGTNVTIYEVKTVGTSKWGRVNTGWICLDYVKLDADVELPEDSTDTTPSETVIATGVVNSNTNLNVRQGPSTSQKLVTTLPRGTKVSIYETTSTKGHTWGRIEKGWICLTYVTLDNAEEINGEGVKGTIVNCTAGANIRSAAGIGNALVGVAPVGSAVTVYTQTTVNGVKWGRIDKGWVCMDYVSLEGTGSNTGSGTDTDTGNDSQTEVSGLPSGTVAADSLNIYEKAASGSEKVGVLIKGSKITVSELVIEEGTTNIWGKVSSGYVNMADVDVNAYAVVTTKTGGQLNVRDSSCDTSKKAVHKLDNGTQVTITAIKAVNGGIWGCIDAEKDYWISLALVKLNAKADTTTKPETDTDTTPSTPDTTPDTTTVKTGVIANTNYVNVRKAAGVQNALVTTLARGTKVTIYEQVTKDNAPWGRIGENQWVAMVYVALDATTSGTTGGTTTGGTTTGGTTTGTTNATGIVNSNVNLNVRTGPGTNYPMVTTLTKGTQINIYEQKLVNGMNWGRCDQGWVSLNYVTMTSSGSTGTGVMGTIARCYYAVNVRSAPGVGNALVGTIMVGSRVEIYEQQAYGGANWGRVAQGWISMDYVLLDSELPGGTIPGTGTDTSTGTGTEPEQDTTTDSETNLVTGFATGTVNHSSKDYLRVLEKAVTGSKEVTSLVNGTQITVSEMVVETSTGKVWGKVASGWLNMAYVDVNAYAVVSTKTGGQLNVRDASCDTSKEPVAKLDNGSQVVITDVKAVGETVWGQIDAEKDHWISLSLVKLNTKAAASNNSTSTGGTTSGTTGSTNTTIGNTVVANGSVLYTGTVTGTVDGVRIRSTPSTNGTELGKLKNGTAVKIYDVAVAEYMAWGKCDSGWVCLTYVDLQSTKEGAVDARVIWQDGLAIRADAGMNYERLASYAKATVVDIYEVKGNWGRTADGWVCLDYLLP